MENFPIQNEKILGNSEEDIDSKRRKFLRDASIVLGGLSITMASKTAVNLLEKILGKNFQKRIDEDTEKVHAIVEDQIEFYESILGEKFEKTNDGKMANQEMKPKNSEVPKKLSDIISLESPDEVSLNSELIEKIKQKWVEQYDEKGRMHQDLRDGLKRMCSYFSHIIRPFEEAEHQHLVRNKKNNGYKKKDFIADPEKLKKYVYLAISESHFSQEAKSPVGATGTYQFMRRTAKNALLKIINGVIDERLDPIKSAKGCANNLTYLLSTCNQNEDLALSGYNGGFIWKYLKEEKTSKNRNYENFLQFIANFINNKKRFYQEKIRKYDEKKYVSYSVKKGDSLSKLQENFGVSIEKIKKTNNLANDNISIKQKLKIPISQRLKNKHRLVCKILYEKEINVDGLIENLNYPAKFKAVMEVIEKLRKEHKIPAIDPENFKPLKMKILKANGKQSLRNFSKDKKTEEALKKINPHILSSKTKLPKGTTVYLIIS